MNSLSHTLKIAACTSFSYQYSSVVSEDDVIPFDPQQPPYTSYVAGPDSENFCSDKGNRLILNKKGVILATTYWQKHALPPSFLWLKEETIRAVEAAGGGAIAIDDPPSTDDVQGTGIFGYEKRRVSNPNFRTEPIIESSVRKSSAGTLKEGGPAAKKLKTAGGKGLKGKKVSRIVL
jgi:hypothetical protein